MSNAAHRNNDLRNCGAKTVVLLQNFVKIESELWAVEDDINNHGHGQLIAKNASFIKINGKSVIVVTDKAKPDDSGHLIPSAATGSGIVSVG